MTGISAPRITCDDCGTIVTGWWENQDGRRRCEACEHRHTNPVIAERDILRSVVRKALSAHPLGGATPNGQPCWWHIFDAEDGHRSIAAVPLTDEEHAAVRAALEAER